MNQYKFIITFGDGQTTEYNCTAPTTANALQMVAVNYGITSGDSIKLVSIS